MEAGITIFNQIIKMFLMMAVGLVLYKRNIINDDTTSRLSDICLYVAMPCVIITSFDQTYSAEKLQGLIVSLALSLAIFIVNIIVSRILYRGSDKRIERFSAVYPNAGFMGIPLVTGLLGVEAVFYISAFLIAFYLFSWTQGVIEMSGRREEVTVKKIVTNPCILGVVIGLIIFFMPVRPFEPLMGAVETLGNLNTPLAMIVLGAYLGRSSLKDMFCNKKAYLSSSVRLVLLPAIFLALSLLLPSGHSEIRTVLLIADAGPVAVMSPMFAQKFGQDVSYAAVIVSLTTLLSLITMPCFIVLSSMIA